MTRATHKESRSVAKITIVEDLSADQKSGWTTRESIRRDANQ